MYRYFFISILLLFLGVLIVGSSLVSNAATAELTITIITPSPTPAPTPVAPSSGGGGGGGALITPPPAIVEFGGVAYPAGIISFLKDGTMVGRTLTDDSGKFTFILSGLSGGTYNFGFWAQDKAGRRSITLTFQLTLVGGSTTKVSGVILPPTIEISKSSVAMGGSLTVSGASTPGAQARIRVASEPRDYFPKVSLGGDYAQTFSVSGLGKGIHTSKSRTELTLTDYSIFSQLIVFGVGVTVPRTGLPISADVNGDGKVNLIDFSIMAYWWKRPLSKGSPVDLNQDGVLNLGDFSILAYNWTG